jgi:hypothetical protein
MIEKKRIKNVDHYLFGLQDGEEFFVGKKQNELSINKLQLLGFSNTLINGEQVLPSILGPISRFNANGNFIKLKDLPMETKYREICVKDWHGNYHYVDVPYRRYQRCNIPAPSVELKIVENGGDFYIVSPLQQRIEKNMADIKHVVNLFLELFGSCDILTKELVPTISDIPARRVNWHILPEGEYPWTRLAQLAGDIASKSERTSKVQEHRFHTMLKYNPSEYIYGAGGFRGYLVFRFPNKNLFVMENVMYGNATYIFENDWKQFSQLTKAEIIQNNLEKGRLEHRSGWESEIEKFLN